RPGESRNEWTSGSLSSHPKRRCSSIAPTASKSGAALPRRCGNAASTRATSAADWLRGMEPAAPVRSVAGSEVPLHEHLFDLERRVTMKYRIAPLFYRPLTLNGMSLKLLESHYENDDGA